MKIGNGEDDEWSRSAAASKAWSPAGACEPRLVARIKNVVFSPQSEWRVIEPESTPVAHLFAGYVLPLALLAAAIGMSIGSGLTDTLMMLVSALFGVFVIGLVIDGLAPAFSGRRDRRQAMKASAYSLTPAMLSAVLAHSSVLSIPLQCLAAGYSIYLLHLGLPVLMQPPKQKAFGYTASVVVCTLMVGVVFAVLSAVASIEDVGAQL